MAVRMAEFTTIIAIETSKGKNTFMFLAPMQLCRKGQWWSKTITHLPQASQCLDLLGLNISGK